MRLLLLLLSFFMIITLSVGIADAYHNSLLESDCDDVQDKITHVTCSDVQYLNSIMLEYQDKMDVINGTLNDRINELEILYYPDEEPIDMVFTVTTDKVSYTGDESITVFVTIANEYYGDVFLYIKDTDGGWIGLKIIYADGSKAEGIIQLGLDIVILNSGTYVIHANYQDKTVETTFEYVVSQVEE